MQTNHPHNSMQFGVLKMKKDLRAIRRQQVASFASLARSRITVGSVFTINISVMYGVLLGTYIVNQFPSNIVRTLLIKLDSVSVY
jgi:hypothetical protein